MPVIDERFLEAAPKLKAIFYGANDLRLGDGRGVETWPPGDDRFDGQRDSGC